MSPVLAAAPGSTHGYDVVDPDRLDPALGTPQDFEALLGELGEHFEIMFSCFNFNL